MSENKENITKTRNYRILSSNWFVTLSATLVGVFVALYLNELVASQKLNEAKANATDNILTEMESNLNSLQGAIETHQKFFDVLDFAKYIDSESEELIVPFDTIMKFRNDYPNLLIVKDSMMVEKGIHAYSNGQLDYNFSLPQFDISTVAWNTLLNTGMSRSYSFECLLYLQGTYKNVEKVITLKEELFNALYRTKDLAADREKILRLLAMLLDYERAAIQALASAKEEIKDCS